MAEALIEREPWWSLLLRGIFIIIFGALVFVWPGISLAVMMIFFGAFVLVDGIFAIVVALSKRPRLWGLTLLGGVVGIVVGILVFMAPLIAGLVMWYLIAAWLLIMGIIHIVTGIKGHSGASIALGILSLCFGIAIFIIPVATLLIMIWLIAAFAVILGISWIVGSVQVKKAG